MFYLLMKATSSSVIRWPSLVAWELRRHKKLLRSIHQWIKPSSVEYLLIGTLTYSFTHLITSYAYNQSDTSSINIKNWSMSCIDIIIKGLDYLKTMTPDKVTKSHNEFIQKRDLISWIYFIQITKIAQNLLLNNSL